MTALADPQIKYAIAFRPDVGGRVGFGHLRRCMSLALALQALGARCVFEIEEGREIVEASGFEIGAVSRADAVVVDSYKVGTDELSDLGSRDCKSVVIDDLADRVLPVDLVLNPGISAEELEYGRSGKALLGIRYALLRPEFAREPERRFVGSAKRLLVTLGGGDTGGLAARLLPVVSCLDLERVHLVVGPLSSEVDELRALAADAPAIELHVDPPDIRGLMLDSDMALSGGGQTLSELAATATPAVAIEVAENQHRNVAGFSRFGAAIASGCGTDSNLTERVESTLRDLAADWRARQHLGENGRRLVDGHGAERAAASILEMLGKAQR